MSDRSFAAMGEKCGIASPPDTSVSSTSCVDSHLAPHPAGLTALTEDLALLDLCMPSLIKQPCDTEEGEVTSSSEIVSAFWNNFPTPLDSVYNEPEKNPFSVITDEDMHCIQTALSTEEGMQILRQTMMKDLSVGYGLDEQDLLADRLIENLTESTGSAGQPVLTGSTGQPVLTESTGQSALSMPVVYTNCMSSFEFVRSQLPETELELTGDLPNVIPQMYPSLPSDEFYSDVLEVLSSNQLDRRPLFDDDDDDDEEMSKPIVIDTTHIDDLVLPDLPPVEDDGRRCEAIDLEADDELVLDDNLLQSFSFIDQSYTSNADNCSSQLDFVFIDDVKLVEGLEGDASSIGATAEGLRDAATSKQLRRSTRIQENEQREMAERIRQENIQREQEERWRADERHLEEHERNKHKDSWSLSLAINSGDSPLDLFTEHSEVFLFDGSEKSHSPRIATPRAGKNKGRGKGGKTGKYHRPTSKAVGVWSNTQAEVSDETVSEDALLKVEMVEEDGGREEGNTLLPSSVEISDQQDESMLVVKMSTEESDCPKEQALVSDCPKEQALVSDCPKEQALVSDCPKEQALGDILSDEKLKAMTKVRLGRLELEAVLSKPITHHAFGAEQEQDTEPAEENVYSKPQTARRRKRKRSDFSYALEPAPDLTKTDLTNEEKLKLEGQDCSSEESAAPILLPSEPAGVTQGAKRKDSHEDDDETLVVTMKKLKNEFENQKTVVEQVKDEVYLIGSSSEELSTANSSEETAVSHEGCKKKNYKKKFSQEDRTQSKIKVMKRRSKSSLKEPDSFKSNFDKPKDKGSKPSRMENWAQEDKMQEKLLEEEIKSQLQEKVLGKKKTDFKRKGIQDQTVASFEKSMHEENGNVQKKKISQEGRGDEKVVHKSSRCRGCQSAVQRLSLYCNKSCLLKYAKLVVEQLKEKKQRIQALLSSGRSKSAEKLVLVERSSGKRVTISVNFCETKLLNWLLKHPTYEVLKPNSQDRNRTKEAPHLKLKLNRPATTCAQDGGNKSSDQTSKTEGKVSPSVQDRLLPSGHLTKVASSHELRKKVDDLQTTKLVSSARRKSSSSSKSEEKSDRLHASLKIPPSKDGRTVDSSVKRLQHQELDATASQTTLHQKNSSSLKSNLSGKTSCCIGNMDKIVNRHESKSGSNKSNNNNATVGRTNSRDNQGNSSCSSNRGSDNKSNSGKASIGNRCNSIDNKSISISDSRNNGIDNKHGSSGDNKKSSIDSKTNNSKSSNGSRKGGSNKSSHGDPISTRQPPVVLEQEQQLPAESLDTTRIDIRTELCSILTSRVNRANDVLMSIPEIKRLTLSIEDAVWKSSCGIGDNYKRKYRLVLAYLTDPKNHSLFRQVLCGRVTPGRLLHMSLTDKLSNRPSSQKASGNDVGSQSHSPAKASTLLMAISDTTSVHGQHVFDVNCRICTGKSSDLIAKKSSDLRAKKTSDLHAKESSDLCAKESSDLLAKKSADLRAKKTSDLRAKENSSRLSQDSASDSHDISAVKETNPVTEADIAQGSISVKEEAEEIDADCIEIPAKVLYRDESLVNGEGVPPWLTTSPVIIPKNSPGPGSDLTDPRDRTRVIPRTTSLVRIKRYSSLPSDTKSAPVFTLKSEISNDIEGRPEDLHSSCSGSSSSGSRVWKGNIFAQDVALVAVDAYPLAGSMKFVKSLLPESLTVMGRLEPEVVYDYLTKLKTCYSATKEIAVVGFRASNDPNSSLYSLLYAYLHQRHRCGVIGSIGTAIKDMYIVPLPAKSPIPDILLPDIGPVLERGRDLLLGVIVQQTSRAARRAVASKDQPQSRCVSHVPTEVKSESIPIADFDEKSPNDASSEAGNIRVSESSDSDSLDVDGSDAIISGYSKIVPLKPAEQKTDLVAVVDVKCEKGPAVDDGDEPYDPFDEEEETDAAVGSVVKVKPTVTSSSSVLPTSSTSLPSKNSCMLNESLANLTAVLSTMTNFPVPATILATLVTQATPPPNLEGLTRLAIILSEQMSALKQEHIPDSEPGIVSGKQAEASVKPEHAIEIDDPDNDVAEPSNGFGVNRSCDDRSKQSETAENDSMVNREKQGDHAMADSDVGRKSELVGIKNQNHESTASDSCRDVDNTDRSCSLVGGLFGLNNRTLENEGTVGHAANKTSLSRLLQVVNTKFSHLEEDDNEDHLVIDLDSSPISEDAFDARPIAKSESWLSGVTAAELGNGAEKAKVNSDVDAIEFFGNGVSGSKSQERTSVFRTGDGSLLTENVDNLRSEEATKSQLFSPSDLDDCRADQDDHRADQDDCQVDQDDFHAGQDDCQVDQDDCHAGQDDCEVDQDDCHADQDDCQQEQSGIIDSVEDEDVFSCKSFATVQETYACKNTVMVQRDSRDAECEEQMGSSSLAASDTLAAKSKAVRETLAGSHSADEDPFMTNYAKESWPDGSKTSNSDAIQDASFSSPHSPRLGLAEEMGPESAEIVDEPSDERVHLDSELLVDVAKSSVSEKPAFNVDKIQEEEKEAVEVTEVAPLPAPPRPPDRLLQSLKPCPLPEPLLRPPSPKTLLTNPFGFLGIFNCANKPVSCVRSTEEVFRDHSPMVHSNAMAGWDSVGCGGPQAYPQTEPDDGGGPFDSLQGQSVRLGGPGDRVPLLSSVQQKFLENKCQNVVGRYDTASPSVLDSSSLLKAQRRAYHDSVSARTWLDRQTPIRTPPPLSCPWKRTDAADASRQALPGSDFSEETDDSMQLGVKVHELSRNSFGRKMAEPASMEQNYLSTDEEPPGPGYGMRRHQQPLNRGLARRSSAKEGRSPPPVESYYRERRIAPAKAYPEKRGGARRKNNNRYESERICQKSHRLSGRYNDVDKETSAATEYMRSWSNECRSSLSNSLLCSAGFSEDLSASSSSRGSLLHFRDETPKPLHFPAAAARPRQRKDDLEKGGLRNSPRAKCASQLSGECPRQLGRSGSQLQNAESSWSEIVSRKEAMSGLDTVRTRRPSRTSLAEESLRFQDLGDRFCHDVDYPVFDQHQEGSAWMQTPGREDWRMNNTSAGEHSHWSFHRENEESMRCRRARGYSRESEVKRWKRGEEEQEEGEYIDDQGGDSSEASQFGLTRATDRLNNFPLMNDALSRRSCSVSRVPLKLNADERNAGENDSPLRVIDNGKLGSKLSELRVEIDPLDARKAEDEELEDGEITDPSPPLTVTCSIPPLLSSYTTDLWAKDFLASKRSGNASPSVSSGISSRRLERTVPLYVPHSNVAKKQKHPEQPPRRFRKSPVANRSGVFSSLHPSCDRYIPSHHQRSIGSHLPDKQDDFSSTGSFWIGSSSGRGPRDRSSNFYPPA